MIVLITADAEADLEAIGDWIAKDTPTRALTFVSELREKCETLSDLPTAYALVPRYERIGIRHRVHRNYLIFYRIVERDYESLLFPEE